VLPTVTVVSVTPGALEAVGVLLPHAVIEMAAIAVIAMIGSSLVDWFIPSASY
jgi:uncharacterized membrane protein SpoIIM required for sporulation